jgi:benzoyl-CoA reductase/2-hydroxyglutaryl-CoA dehydratase subunit BcrC/BadD/HgdB
MAAVPRRSDVIESFKGRGGSVAAVFPIHYPRALLRAFDLLPVEVWGPPKVDTSPGAAHLQPNVCSIVRNGLSFLLSGGLEVADLVVVPHACDSLQGLGSILTDLVPTRFPVIPIYLPRGRRQCDVDFLADEFRSVHRRLESITGRTPSEGRLRVCIQREEEADEVLAALHRERPRMALSGGDFYRLIRAREYLPAEEFSELGRQTLGGEKVPSSTPAEPPAMERSSGDRGRIPLMLSGIVPEPVELLEALEGIGGWVVADDLACCGRRLYGPGSSEEPFHRLAERLLNTPPDPTRGSPIAERVAHLEKLLDTSGARGVVFYDVKFCEPELFDLPILGAELERLSIHSLIVEADINDPLPSGVVTRLEAFLEMIQ